MSYRWFLGYGLLDKMPHFATVSYAFCRHRPHNGAENPDALPAPGFLFEKEKKEKEGRF